MTTMYLALLRGINVGGKNKVPMAELKACFEELGCENVRTYIASGNVIFESGKSSAELAEARMTGGLPSVRLTLLGGWVRPRERLVGGSRTRSESTSS
jgi:hypothetical protein